MAGHGQQEDCQIPVAGIPRWCPAEGWGIPAKGPSSSHGALALVQSQLAPSGRPWGYTPSQLLFCVSFQPPPQISVEHQGGLSHGARDFPGLGPFSIWHFGASRLISQLSQGHGTVGELPHSLTKGVISCSCAVGKSRTGPRCNGPSPGISQ